jgi:DNA-binding CsgD family transcriptional regulator
MVIILTRVGCGVGRSVKAKSMWPLATQMPRPDLSAREVQVLDLIVRGARE